MPFAASTAARLRQPAPIRRGLQVPEIGARLQQAVQIASASRPAVRRAPPLPAGLMPLLPAHLAWLLPVGLAPPLPARLAPLLPDALTLAPGPSAVRLARLAVSSLTA
jgi:hypothetical protein